MDQDCMQALVDRQAHRQVQCCRMDQDYMQALVDRQGGDQRKGYLIVG